MPIEKLADQYRGSFIKGVGKKQANYNTMFGVPDRLEVHFANDDAPSDALQGPITLSRRKRADGDAVNDRSTLEDAAQRFGVSVESNEYGDLFISCPTEDTADQVGDFLVGEGFTADIIEPGGSPLGDNTDYRLYVYEDTW